MTTPIEDARAARDAIRDNANYGDGGIDNRVLSSIETAIDALIAEHERVLTGFGDLCDFLDNHVRPAPPTDDEREALATVLASAYHASPYRDAHLRGADEILASDVWRNRRQGPITDAQVDRVAEAIARVADADYWTTEISEWEGSEDWEREAHPDNYPDGAYEDREWYRKQARAALEAARDAS